VQDEEAHVAEVTGVLGALLTILRPGIRKLIKHLKLIYGAGSRAGWRSAPFRCLNFGWGVDQGLDRALLQGSRSGGRQVRHAGHVPALG
jgi:hypothetical protein